MSSYHFTPTTSDFYFSRMNARAIEKDRAIEADRQDRADKDTQGQTLKIEAMLCAEKTRLYDLRKNNISDIAYIERIDYELCIVKALAARLTEL